MAEITVYTGKPYFTVGTNIFQSENKLKAGRDSCLNNPTNELLATEDYNWGSQNLLNDPGITNANVQFIPKNRDMEQAVANDQEAGVSDVPLLQMSPDEYPLKCELVTGGRLSRIMSTDAAAHLYLCDADNMETRVKFADPWVLCEDSGKTTITNNMTTWYTDLEFDASPLQGKKLALSVTNAYHEGKSELKITTTTVPMTVTVAKVGEGVITINGKESEQMSRNDTASLYIKPATGYYVKRVNSTIGDVQPVEGSDTAYFFAIGTVADNCTITAIFEQIDYSITRETKPGNGGTIALVPNQQHYHYGDEVQAYQTPSAGSFIFSGWGMTGGGVVNDDGSFTMPASDAKIIAYYGNTFYPLHKAVSPEGAGVIYDPAESFMGYSEQFVPQEEHGIGYTLNTWLVKEGENQPRMLSEAEYTMPESEVTLTAVYTPNTYTCAVLASDPNGGSPELKGKTINNLLYSCQYGEYLYIDPHKNEEYRVARCTVMLDGSNNEAEYNRLLGLNETQKAKVYGESAVFESNTEPWIFVRESVFETEQLISFRDESEEGYEAIFDSAPQYEEHIAELQTRLSRLVDGSEEWQEVSDEIAEYQQMITDGVQSFHMPAANVIVRVQYEPHDIIWGPATIEVEQNEYVLTFTKTGTAIDNLGKEFTYCVYRMLEDADIANIKTEGVRVAEFSANSDTTTCVLGDNNLEIPYKYILCARYQNISTDTTIVSPGAVVRYTALPVHKTIGYYTGNEYVECIPYYYIGQEWVEVEPYIYTGGQWELCSMT